MIDLMSLMYRMHFMLMVGSGIGMFLCGVLLIKGYLDEKERQVKRAIYCMTIFMGIVIIQFVTIVALAYTSNIVSSFLSSALLIYIVVSFPKKLESIN